MSMWLSVVALAQPVFEKVRQNPDLLQAVFADGEDTSDELRLSEAERAGADYRSLSEALEAIAEAMGEGDDEADFDASGDLEYDMGYGNAEYIEATALSEVSQNATWSLAAEIEPDLQALFDAAIEHKKTVVFIVS